MSNVNETDTNETETTNIKDKLMSETESAVSALKRTVEQTATMISTAKGMIGKEQAMLKDELDHVIQAAKYLKTNWKKAVPAIAAVGAGAYLLSLRNAKKTAKKTVSTGKKLEAKAKSSAKKAVKKVTKSAKKATTSAKKTAKRK